MILQGGLGNQLFIYFAAKFIENNYGKKIFFISNAPDRLSEVGIKSTNSKYVLPKYLFIILNIILRKFTFFKITRKFVYSCKDIGYENLDDKIDRIKFLSGYFQTNYYIENCEMSLSIMNDIDQYLEANCNLKYDYIYNNSIALHVRRGDYLLEKNSYFGILSFPYYLNALKKLSVSGNFDKVYLFSDSKIDSKLIDNLKLNFINLNIIDTSKQNLNDISTLALLSRFPGQIISNSTFSWWGAYLGRKNKIVAAPSIWFKKHQDPQRIFPISWETIESKWE
jgi:hypothetical protein